MNMNKFIDPCVYALRVGDGLYAYVGSTSKNAQNRLWEHIYRARSGHNAPVYQWMRDVGVENVAFDILERVEDAEARAAAEVAHITRLLAAGHPLVNQISRDGSIDSHSEVSRAAISAARSGKSSWIKGKRGEAAGWTPERRAAAAERMRLRAAARRD